MTELDTSQLDLSATHLIEASAGTGKTYTITNLCLRLLLGRGQPPLAISQILILTFTNAATDELKERVANRLQEARLAFRHGTDDAFLQEIIDESTDPARDLKLLTAASQLMDEASIFTIHGFCKRVLNERAFESGVLFQQTLDADENQMLQMAVEDCFRNSILSLEPDLRSIALKLWPKPVMLAEQLKPLLFQSGMTIYPSGIAGFEPGQLVADARAAKKGWLDENTSALIESGFDGRYAPKKRLKSGQDFWHNPSADFDSDMWEIYSRENLEKSARGDLPRSHILDLIDHVHSQLTLLPAWLWYYMLIQVRLLITGYKSDWHQLTIDDLVTLTAAAVSRPGSRLAELLAERWPVAMVDEFQDTDPIQYGIFNAVYRAEGQDASLLMIGDPKQAIYQFRGADVFTYINARQSAASVSTLKTNWRSTPALISATNHLFQKPGIFGSATGISFDPVSAAARNSEKQMTIAGQTPPPYQLCIAGQETGTMTADVALELMMDFAAEEVAGLLDPASEAQIDDTPIDAGQIAFMVRRRREAAAAKAALARRGIRSVYLTQESVLHQETAQDLKLILDAVAEPTNDRAIRSALATRLMQSTAEEIDALNHEVAYQQAVLEEFRDYHDLWRNKQLATMLTRLMARRRLAEKWLHHPEGERQLTNLRHLSELLQERAMVTPGMFQLIKWFERQQVESDPATAEERQLRLESDENLIKIVTMHAAKGLEYDIVMLPMPVFSQRGIGSRPAVFHEHDGRQFRTALELGNNQENRQHALKEQRDEEMRLLYVALTRARYRCYIGVPQVRDFAKSCIAELLGLQGLARSMDLRDCCATEQSEGRLPAAMFTQVNVEIPDINSIAETRPGQTFQAPPARPANADQWRVHSYTGVIARIGEPHITRGYDDDDPAQVSKIAALPSRFTFPRGPRVGIALHALLEDLDFTDAAQQHALCLRTCRTLGLQDEWLTVLSEWLADILASPLGDYSLSDIDRADRLDELEFHFPLQTGADLVARLNDLGYLRSRHVPTGLSGMMTGLIDLLYRYNDQYFIIDYKSNFLGFLPDDYQPELLAEAMLYHHYALQFLIYTIATHRMLKNSLPDYDYEHHFGGIHYLFLRGMDGSSRNGIYSHRPDISLVTELDRLLGETG